MNLMKRFLDIALTSSKANGWIVDRRKYKGYSSSCTKKNIDVFSVALAASRSKQLSHNKFHIKVDIWMFFVSNKCSNPKCCSDDARLLRSPHFKS
jgi:hypothetical protein